MMSGHDGGDCQYVLETGDAMTAFLITPALLKKFQNSPNFA